MTRSPMMTNNERRKLEREAVRTLNQFRIVEEYRPGPGDTVLRLEPR